MEFLVLIVLLVTVQTCTAKMESVQFQKVRDVYKTVQPIGKSYKTSSHLQCSAKCLQESDTCKSYLFDASESNCILGSILVANGNARGADTRLYWIEPPSITSTPTATSLASTTSYSPLHPVVIGIYNTYVNFFTAEYNCAVNSSHLITLETYDKLQYYKNALSFDIWLGLRYYSDDTECQGFAWNSYPNPNTKCFGENSYAHSVLNDGLFASENYGYIFKPSDGLIYTVACTEIYQYACERDM